MADDLEQITGPVAYHGEGPVWHPNWGGLRWVDMLAGDVLGFDSRGEVTRTRVGAVAAAIAPRAGGGMVAGIERGFALVDPDGTVTALPELWPAGPTRMNEGASDPHGRFHCGSISKEHGGAALYRLHPDGTVATVLGGLTVSNGIAWSPDGTRAFYVDTATQRVDVFDYDVDAGLIHRRPAFEIPREAGSPDGITIDEQGYVWVALFRGAAVRRYSPDGVLDRVVELPVSLVTSCALGGDDLRDLYITTSRENLPDGVDPDGGSLYRIRVDVPGVLVHSFAG
jgi:sugar lactone lactonase YvrE